MKKIVYLTFILLQVNLVTAYSQYLSDIAQYEIKYQLTFVVDSLNKADVKSENASLFICKTKSFFKSSSSSNFDSVIQANITQFKNSNQVINTNGLKRGGIRIDLVKDFSNNRILEKQFLVKNYSVIDTITQIKWQILLDTLTILTFHCQKAVGYYKGRTYTAWFSEQLPFKDGPWKLQGLPGLILEATDNRNEVHFKLLGIDNLDISKEIQYIAKSEAEVSIKDFFKLKKAYSENPAVFIESQLQGLYTTSETGMKITYPPNYKFKISKNEIELCYN